MLLIYTSGRAGSALTPLLKLELELGATTIDSPPVSSNLRNTSPTIDIVCSSSTVACFVRRKEGDHIGDVLGHALPDMRVSISAGNWAQFSPL